MYNKQLESLIQTALADGVITDKEREILLKRAKSLGIDEDEFEIELENRLVEWKKEHQVRAQVGRPEVQTTSTAPMFSKELESLIQAVLEDGVIEDYEREALVKRANAEGVDLAELKIYINSVLQKRKKEHEKKEDAKQNVIDQNKREAFGKVCPNCGKQITSMTLMCDCGYEFPQDTHVSSYKILADKIDKIYSEHTRHSDESFMERVSREKEQTKKIVDAITIFPVPSIKEDIIDFLSMATTNSSLRGGIWGSMAGRLKILGPLYALTLIVGLKAVEFIPFLVLCAIPATAAVIALLFFLGQDMIASNKIAMAWRNKFSQVMMKARTLRGDTEFNKQLDNFESQVESL